MTRAILDQNGIILLDEQANFDEILISPMFMWEIFNNIENSLSGTLISFLKSINHKIFITYKSTTCESLELESKTQLKFEDITDTENTNFIREWLGSLNNSLSDLRDVLAPGFSKSYFDSKLDTNAETSWLPKLQNGFSDFPSPTERIQTREKFEKIEDSVNKILFDNTLSACFQELAKKGFSEEQAVLFLKQPTIFYNRVFCHFALFEYRSTQASKGSLGPEKISNDTKDIEYLFCLHLVDDVISEDKFMKMTILHLKKSYGILASMKTGLS